MVASEIKKALDELAIACEVISASSKCKMCPLKDCCFDDYSIVDVAYKTDEVAISRMTCMAEIITERQEETEKSEYQRRWEHEADEWLDKGKEI